MATLLLNRVPLACVRSIALPSIGGVLREEDEVLLAPYVVIQ
jgi:hypothetical protein